MKATVSINLKLKPEIEASLLARANASGMSLEDYLVLLAEKAARSQGLVATNAPAASSREIAVRQMLEFGDKYHLSLGESITRKFLQEGHRF